MKRSIALVLLIVMLMLCSVGCRGPKKLPEKLVELEKYSSMTIDGTTSIDVVYDYTEGEFATYEFVITNQGVIDEIMAEVFSMGLKEYPENQDMNFYQRWLTIMQGDKEFYVSLAYTTDENGNRYLCQSENVCEIIEKCIRDSYIEQ